MRFEILHLKGYLTYRRSVPLSYLTYRRFEIFTSERLPSIIGGQCHWVTAHIIGGLSWGK